MVREDALDWFEEAQVDLRRAEWALEIGDYSLSCYMAQQAVEKGLKACYIGLLRRLPPKTHDLTMLYDGLRGLLKLPRELEESLPELSQYYVTARYPNAGLRRPSRSFSLSQARRGVEVARRVLEEVGRALHTA